MRRRKSELTEMTVFFRKNQNLKEKINIENINTGRCSLNGYKNLTLEDAEMIYEAIVVDYDEFIFFNVDMFDFKLTDNNEYKFFMRDEWKEKIKKYL